MRITIPIRGPEFQKLERSYDHFLKDISGFGSNEKLVRLIDNEPKYKGINNIDFKIIKSSKYLEKENPEIIELKKKHPDFKNQYVHEFLIIKINFNRDYSENTMGIIIANQIIKRLSLLAHLSYSTKIDFLRGLIYIDKKYLGQTNILISDIDYVYEHSDKINWPRISSVNLNKTISWYSKNNLHTDKSSQTKLHRAINAFSYSFSDLHEKDTAQLFWIMLGIEALLAEGNNNISSQIKNKSILILGEPQEFKKKLNKLYAYRSRFIHGDLDFPAKFSSDYDRFESEYWDFLSFATSILLALIRELIDRNENEFKFEYKLIH